MHPLNELLAKPRRVRRSVLAHLELLKLNHKVFVKWAQLRLHDALNRLGYVLVAVYLARTEKLHVSCEINAIFAARRCAVARLYTAKY